jgi:hypothetical protein
MLVRKILLAAAAATLIATPAWALPSQAPPHAGGGNGQQGDAPDHPGKPSQPGKSHKCKPHTVAYVASGLLVSQTLTLDGSGNVTVDVKRTNHHAAGDKGKTVTYSVSHVRVTFALPDVNDDGSSGLDDLQAGDRVKLIGKVTAIAKKCDHTSFTPTTTIRHIVFHGPPSTSTS